MFFQDPTNPVDREYRLFQGGFGSGKTFAAGLFHIRRALITPGLITGIYAPTVDQLRGTILKTILELLDLFNLNPGQDYIYHKTHNTITFSNKAVFEFKGLMDNTGTSVRGRNYHACHVEEAAGITKESFDEVEARCRAVMPESASFPHIITLNTNPHAKPGFWLNELFSHVKTETYYKQDNGTYTTEKQKGSIDFYSAGEYIKKVMPAPNTVSTLRYVLIKASTATNTTISPSYVAGMLTNYDAETAKRLVLGETAQEATNCVNWAFTKANTGSFEFDPKLNLYLTCDFNIDPNCWVFAQSKNNKLYFLREFCIENCPTDKLIKAIYGAVPNEWKRTHWLITGDPSGNARKSNTGLPDYKIIEDFLISVNQAHTLIVPSKHPPVELRIRSANLGWCDATGVQRVFIDQDKCPHLINNCYVLKFHAGNKDLIWEPTAYDIKKTPKLKFTKHIWDAATYLVHQLFGDEATPTRPIRVILPSV